MLIRPRRSPPYVYDTAAKLSVEHTQLRNNEDGLVSNVQTLHIATLPSNFTGKKQLYHADLCRRLTFDRSDKVSSAPVWLKRATLCR